MDRRKFVSALALGSLSACGGGGDSTPATSPASGGSPASPPTPASTPGASDYASQLTDQYVNALRATWGEVAPSVSIGVVQGGTVLKQAAYGYAQIDPPVAASASTSYLLASLTKQFTAAALMVMVQNGQASVDDYLSQYFTLPSDPAWALVKLRHLLTHTAGLARYSPVPGVGVQNSGSPVEAMRSFTEVAITTPGQSFLYSDAGYAILGMVLREIAARYPAAYPANTYMPDQPPTYNDILQTLLFGPTAANMPNTGIDFQQGKNANLSIGYTWTNDKWVVGPTPNRPVGAGLIESRIADMIVWDQALRGTAILSAASKQQMWTTTPLPDNQVSDYGFGWEIGTTLSGGTVISHNGDAGEAFNTAIYRFLDTGYTVVVLINMERTEGYGGSLPNVIAQQVANFYSPDNAS